MHCFFGLLASLALLSGAVAANLRPIITVSRKDTVLPASKPASQGYQEQDTSRAFYSYGYSDENAARAEYTTLDGTSRGFYAYVDANGKLQTVKYEAGGSQGFKAEASNQPKAPVDDKQPVMDTAEVQQARLEHLNAIRQAQEEERREQALKQKQKQQRTENKNSSSSSRQQTDGDNDDDDETLSDEDAAILERVRAELTSMLAERQREESNQNANEQQSREQDAQSAEAAEADAQAQAQQEQTAVPQRESSNNNNNNNDKRLRTVYSLADLRSSSYLKLSDLQDRVQQNGQDVSVPVAAYYSYVSPSTQYSVTTPTELRNLRPVALSRSVVTKRN